MDELTDGWMEAFTISPLLKHGDKVKNVFCCSFDWHLKG